MHSLHRRFVHTGESSDRRSLRKARSAHPHRGGGMKRRGLIFGIVVIAVAALAGLLAPWISAQDPGVFDLASRLGTARPGHILGFDEEGRDLLSLILWGARVSLTVSILTVAISGTLGTLIGLAAGYFGGLCDRLFTFVSDV